MITKILIVDDSELLHRMYDLVFAGYKSKGVLIIHAFNGMDALTKLNEHPDTSLIVLDINMPVMSGLEFLHHCKNEKVFQDIPVIIISTEGKQEDTIRGIKAGATAYLTKPFQPRELHNIVQRIFTPQNGSIAVQAEQTDRGVYAR